MRDYKDEARKEKEKWARLVFRIDRAKYDALTEQQQDTLKAKVRKLIGDFVKKHGKER